MMSNRWLTLGKTVRVLLIFFAGALSFAAAPGPDYLDSRVCAKCHSQIAATYRRTGMGRSLYRATPNNLVEDFTKNNQFLHALSDTHYSMNVRDGVVYQRRWQIGFDGKETNVEEMKIDYVIGSGNHSRSYLHRTPSGGMIELPLSWYSEKGGYWAMSPGFDSRHPQTRRFVSYECIGCHNAIPAIPPSHDSASSEPVFSGNLPEGIDCQRCHGPGGKHVGLVQTAGSKLSDVRASIVNPSRLTPALSMDVCMQCHLEPTSTEMPSLIRRFNRGPFSFKPGEPLSNILLAFDHAAGTGYDDKFEIVGSSAYRLRKSKCFLESKGSMTCLTCHDPHNAPRGPQAVKQYSDVCRQCHAAPLSAAIAAGKHPAAAECISCHMPKRRTDDVVHAVMTDHYIQSTLPARDLLADLREQHTPETEPYRGEVVPYYPSPLPQKDQNNLYRDVAQVILHNNLKPGVVELARDLEKSQPHEPQFYKVLGDAWQSSGKPREAIAAYERALKLGPDSTATLISLANAFKINGELSRADGASKRALANTPASAAAWFQSGTIAFDLGQVSSAIEKMQKAILLDPDTSGGRTALGQLFWRTGKNDRAADELTEALRTDPYDADAYNLSGRILAGKSQMPEALFDLEKATKVRSNYAPHLYDYALALSSVNRLDEAAASVEAALQADPDMAEAHALQGTLLSGKRQFAEAVHEYEEAVRIRPDFARAHFDLARVLVAQGNVAEALPHLKKAAEGNDPTVAQVAGQALQRLQQH